MNALARIPRFWWGAALVIAVVTIIAFAIRTRQPLPAPPSADMLAQYFGIPSSLPVTSPDSISIDLCIDVSPSMSGFATRTSTRFLQTILRLVESSLSARLPVLVRRMDEALSAGQPPDLVRLVEPGFYQSGTVDRSGITTGLSLPLTGRSVLVIVSDFDEPAANPPYHALRAAMLTALATRPFAMFLAFRSGFDGPVFPVDPSRASFDAHLPNIPNWVGRPFYVLALAPDARALRQFRSQVVSMLEPDEYFVAGGEVAQCMALTALSLPSGPEGPASSEERELKRINASQDSPWLATFVQTTATSTALRLDLGARVLWKSVVDKPPNVAFSVVGVRFGARGNPVPLSTTAARCSLRQARVDSLNFRVIVPKPPNKSWDAYRVVARAASPPTQLPGWIGDWNTEQDHSRADLHKTYGLRQVVHAVLGGGWHSPAVLDVLLRVSGDSRFP